MRRSVLRWLLQRGKPKIKPLALRTTWGDFAFRMRRAIDIDIQVELGEVTLAELKAMHITRPLPVIEHGAPTEAAPAQHGYWYYSDEKRTWTMPTTRVEV